MQTWITDKNIYTSAENIDDKRLFANIYEGIHVLASLLNINDKLVTPKRSVINHPAAKLWQGYEIDLLYYLIFCFDTWLRRFSVAKDYKKTINYRNLMFIKNDILKINNLRINYNRQFPAWVTDDVIQTHRSVLIQKEIKSWYDLQYDIKMIEHDDDILESQKPEVINKKYKKAGDLFYYRKLWPNCTRGLPMRYDWRNK